MAERLEEFDKLNVDRLIYEKSKTEAIIESLEDGIVMIDPNGIVAHINELAAIILGVEREAALGSPFDDLDSSHPHYLRIRAALAETRGTPTCARSKWICTCADATTPICSNRCRCDMATKGPRSGRS